MRSRSVRTAWQQLPSFLQSTVIGHRYLAHAANMRVLRRFELERSPLWHTPGIEPLCASDVEPLDMRELLSLEQDSEGAIEALMRLSLGYPHSHGSEPLREAVAQLYDSPAITPDDVTICAPQEGILLGMLALCRPGEKVVVVTPGYQSLGEVAHSVGCEVVPWRCKLGDGAKWYFDVADLERLLPGASVLVTCFPHNPTGALPTPAEWTRTEHLCAKHGVRIFSDEMYRGLECLDTNARRGDTGTETGASAEVDSGGLYLPRLASSVDMHAAGERHVALGGLSKWAALPGLRLGWLASADRELMTRIREIKDYTSICPPAPSEHLGLIALRHRHQLLRRSLELCTRGLGHVRQFCEEHADWVQMCEPQGGSVCFPGLRRQEGGAKTTAAERWCQELAADDQTRLMLIPATLFGAEGDGADACDSSPHSHFRVGYGRANVAELLDRLRDHVRRNGPPV